MEREGAIGTGPFGKTAVPTKVVGPLSQIHVQQAFNKNMVLFKFEQEKLFTVVNSADFKKVIQNGSECGTHGKMFNGVFREPFTTERASGGQTASGETKSTTSTPSSKPRLKESGVTGRRDVFIS